MHLKPFIHENVLIIAAFLSCKKNDTEAYLDNRCTNNVTDSAGKQLVSDKELDTIQYLFSKNGLNSNNIQFFKYERFNDGGKYVAQYQYVNNLKVFPYRLDYHFNAFDSLTSTSGQKITSIDMPNTPRLSNSYVRGVFVNGLGKGDVLIQSDSIYNIIANGCIDIEFGYFDLNLGQDYLQYKFTPAWHVKPVGFFSLNEAYIDDITGKKILNY